MTRISGQSRPGNGFPEHHAPDYWRFLPDSQHALFNGLELLASERLAHRTYTQLIGIAQKR